MKRLLLAVVTAVTVLLVSGAPASAHVTVNPREATAGGYTKLSVRVPNERDDASTVAVSITIPEGFESISVRPTQGWEHRIDGTTITWSGGEIAPGEFQEFDISVGPVPSGASVLHLPAIQTYDSGEVVRWIEEAEEGSDEEPEHPAPVLQVIEGGDDGHGAAASPSTSAASESSEGTDTLTFAALLLGGLAVVLALVALVRAGRRIPQ